MRGGMSKRHHEQGARLRGSAVLKYCIFTMGKKTFQGSQEIRERHSGVLMKPLHSKKRSLEKRWLGMYKGLKFRNQLFLIGSRKSKYSIFLKFIKTCW